MAVATADWARIEMLRRTWVPPTGDREEELCVEPPHAVSVQRVSVSRVDDEGGVRYYQCGGGRRVIRKRIGGD